MELLKSSRLTNNIVNTSALTIGTFDGMHLGHIHLIENMLALSKKNNCPSVVITFNPNPFIVLNNLDKSKYNLINNRKRFEILKSLGVDYLCEIEFDKNVLNNISVNKKINLLVSRIEKDFMKKFAFNSRSVIAAHCL